MDLETENRLAALLMDEARRLRAEADREGVGVHIRQPNVRGRPNSRFLTATVLGVEQANRAVQVNEMWRAREKELELEAKLKGNRLKDKAVCYNAKDHGDFYRKGYSARREEKASRIYGHDDRSYHSSDEGALGDDEVETFLLSRTKRGRGAVGSRMDEPGPYPLATSCDDGAWKPSSDAEMRQKEDWERRILGPEKPSFIKPHNSPPQASSMKKHHSERKKRKRSSDERSERRNDKEKTKKCKHRHHKSRRS